MKNQLLIAFALLSSLQLSAQVPYNAALPNGYTKKASVSEAVGLSVVTINYHRPWVKGREGNIWGETVHKGFIDQGFGTRNAAPWRAGANENTIIEFSDDVKVEGQSLAKGSYAFFLAYDPQETILIFSKQINGWGSFYYDEKNDALRVKVKPSVLEKSVEQLKYEFTSTGANSAIISLSWEKLAIAFKVEVDYMRQQYDALLAAAQHPTGFTAQGLTASANWTLENNYQLEKGLEWATAASSRNFPGDPTFFKAAFTRALILEKMGKLEDATTAIKNAFPVGSMAEVQQAGRQLLKWKKPADALLAFRFNYEKHPDQFVALAGMMRGLSATGDYVKSLEFANKALALAPNEQNRQAIQGMIEKLKAGNDINE